MGFCTLDKSAEDDAEGGPHQEDVFDYNFAM
jgi:hypothetical protein